MHTTEGAIMTPKQPPQRKVGDGTDRHETGPFRASGLEVPFQGPSRNCARRHLTMVRMDGRDTGGSTGNVDRMELQG